MPEPPAERGYTSEQMIRQVQQLQAVVADLDAAGLRWPRETTLDADKQSTYERILTAHGVPIRRKPPTTEEIAFCERVERMQAEIFASEVTS
jgi:hypothetical protein